MTSLAIISDVHSNLEALHAVLSSISTNALPNIHFLGDCVGYGPNPLECLGLLQEHTHTFIAGNHDRGAVDAREASSFNPYAKAAIEWTGELLETLHKNFLHALPLTAVLEDHDILLVHGSPHEPEKWHYVSSAQEAQAYFPYFAQSLCFVGHSHIPFIAELSASGSLRQYSTSCRIRTGSRYIVNSGSVGQPRDGDPRASYAVVEGDRIRIKRLSYDIVRTQKKMKDAGLPSYLIQRLAEGR